MTKFRTQFKVYEPDTERFTKPSQTMPSQAYTIRELLARFVSGTYSPEQAYRNGSYADGEPSFEDYDPTDDGSFDLADYTEGILELERRKAVQVEEEWRRKQSDSSPTSPPAEPVAELSE